MNNPELTPTQAGVVDEFKSTIRQAAKKLNAYYNYNKQPN